MSRVPIICLDVHTVVENPEKIEEARRLVVEAAAHPESASPLVEWLEATDDASSQADVEGVIV